jgi:hypothetical protein
LALALIFVALAVIPDWIFRQEVQAHRAKNACINNLRQIDAAKQQWALENLITNLNATPTASDLQPYIGRGNTNVMLYCPLDPKHSFTNSYNIKNIGAEPQCRFTNRNPEHVLPK